jgi:hypothetical protein
MRFSRTIFLFGLRFSVNKQIDKKGFIVLTDVIYKI